MSDHIGSFLSLHYQIVEASQKINDIHIVYAILLSIHKMDYSLVCDV